MPSRLVKMKTNMPHHVEHRLVDKWGFAVDKRIVGEFVLFKKTYVSDKIANDIGVQRTIRASITDKPTSTTTNTIVPITPHKSVHFLTSYEKNALERRCDRIVNMFPDPFSVPQSVRARLSIAIQKMTMPEAQFVLEYMDENFPLSDKGT